MSIPSNFIQAGFSSFQEAFSLSSDISNTPLSLATDEKIGSLWTKIFGDHAPCSAPIFEGSTEGEKTFLGSGQWISPTHYLTAAHVIDRPGSSVYTLSSNQKIFELNPEHAIINKVMDYALYRLDCPFKDVLFAPLASRDEICTHYGMIHYAMAADEPHVTIGALDSTPYSQLRPCLNIDGGQGSSGAAVFDETGKLACLHISKHKRFETLRYNIHIQDILADAYSLGSQGRFEDQVTVSFDFYDEFSDEIPESRFTAMAEVKKDTCKFPAAVFEKATEFVDTIKETKKDDYFTKVDTGIKTIYQYTHIPEDPYHSLRMDIQNPGRGFSNIHIQYQRATLSGILIAKELCYFDPANPSYIQEFVHYTLDTLSKTLAIAKNHKKAVIATINKK